MGLAAEVRREPAHPGEHVVEGVGEVALLDPIGEAPLPGGGVQEVLPGTTVANEERGT